MTNNEINQAIAEVRGYVWYRAPKDRHFSGKHYRFLAYPAVQEFEQVDIWKQRADGTERIITSRPWLEAQGVLIPDYCGDLNAIHEAIMSQPVEIRCKINHTLMEMANPQEAYLLDRTINATAAQRAEAFLRTLGKWRTE